MTEERFNLYWSFVAWYRGLICKAIGHSLSQNNYARENDITITLAPNRAKLALNLLIHCNRCQTRLRIATATLPPAQVIYDAGRREGFAEYLETGTRT